MKKLSFLLSVVLLLTFALASCGETSVETTPVTTTPVETTPLETTPAETTPVVEPEPDSAAALWAKIDETMSAMESCEMNTNADMVIYINGYKMVSKVTGVVIEICGNADSYYYYQNAVSSVQVEELMMDQTVSVMEAYYDGKMFTSYSDGNVNQKFYSVMSADDFASGGEESSLATLDFNNCTTSSFKKNEDGTWTLNYSGYTGKTINAIAQELGFTQEMVGANIDDMEITIVADGDYRIKEMQYVFVFPTGTTTPTIRVTSTYTKYNEATPVTDVLNTADYVELEDARFPEKIATMLTDISEAEAGAFVLDITQNVTILDSTTSWYEKDTVSFGVNNGSYFYNILVATSEGDMTIDFKNGLETIVVDGETYTEYITAAVAKEYINSLINGSGYDATLVKNVTKMSDGVYVLECMDPSVLDYGYVFEGMGGEYASGTQTYAVTVKEDKLERMECSIDLLGHITVDGTTYDIVYEIAIVNIFQTEVTPNENGGSDPTI
ncbi:MAG: hypothetical protein IJY12_05670 [Clostridia bacterium]|nr:hypothetical protein [Clostridia bacterium]